MSDDTKNGNKSYVQFLNFGLLNKTITSRVISLVITTLVGSLGFFWKQEAFAN